jgi:hypothetical protein
MVHGARRTPQGIRQPSKGAAAAPIAADGPVQCLALMASGATGMAERY